MTRRWTDLSQSERDHLIWTMLAEARGEGDEGLAGVAWVIRNRSNHPDWPASIVGVVTRVVSGDHEFSPWGDGSLVRYADGHRLYEQAERVAEQVFNAERSADPTRGATFFEATSITDTWMENNSRSQITENGIQRPNIENGIQQSRLIRGVVIGNHQFYNLSSYYYREVQNRENGIVLRDGSRDTGVVSEVAFRDRASSSPTSFHPILTPTPSADELTRDRWARLGVDLSWMDDFNLTRRPTVTPPNDGWRAPLLPGYTMTPTTTSSFMLQVATADEQAILNAFNQQGRTEVNLRGDVETNTAVRDLQEALGVRVDGIVGHRTRAAFDSSRFNTNNDDPLSLGELRAALTSIRQDRARQRD